jgi:acetyl-CoA acetyltransferase family protein
MVVSASASSVSRVFVVAAARSPIGRLGGQLASVRVDDLLSQVIPAVLKPFTANNANSNSNNIDPALIDDVIIGCANQAGEDNRNIARMSLLLAGLPYSVPGTTINRLCGSSLDAAMDGYARIRSGIADCVLVGGAESMTRGPYVLAKANTSYDRDQKMYDTTFGWRFPNKAMEVKFPLLSMGQTAEEVARELSISRRDQDVYAMASHQKAISARKRGLFDAEIVPIQLPSKPPKTGSSQSVSLISKDEGPREDISLESLSMLKPVFRTEKEGGTVTAGNACPMSDGAAALLLVSESFLNRYHSALTPLVEITGAAVRGIHPSRMGLGPVEAVNVLLTKYSKKITDFDVVELNEAFAAQALGCIRQLDLDPSKVNIHGGSIALGHPLGCSGARILTTMVHAMQTNKKTMKEGLATMCIGVGQGIALSVRNC